MGRRRKDGDSEKSSPSIEAAKWHRTPQWWALIISALSLLFTFISFYVNRSFPPSPRVQVLSLLPILLKTTTHTTWKSHELRLIAEVFNETNHPIVIDDIVIAGSFPMERKFEGFKSTITISLICASTSKTIIHPYSTEIAIFEVMKWEDSDADAVIHGGGGRVVRGYLDLVDDKGNTITAHPGISYILDDLDKVFPKLGSEFKEGLLRFYLMAGGITVKIDPKIIMDLDVCFNQEEWNDTRSLRTMYKRAKGEWIIRKMADK